MLVCFRGWVAGRRRLHTPQGHVLQTLIMRGTSQPMSALLLVLPSDEPVWGKLNALGMGSVFG